MDTNNSNRLRHHRKPLDKMSYSNKGRFYKMRNILNTLFVLMAIIGMAIYFFSNTFVGGAILIVCVFIKLTESTLRIIH